MHFIHIPPYLDCREPGNNFVSFGGKYYKFKKGPSEDDPKSHGVEIGDTNRMSDSPVDKGSIA